MSPTPKIVVTGFEPFAHGSENPTLEVFAQLRRSNDIEGELTTVQMPVGLSQARRATSAKLDELQPDVWISLGVAPGLAVVAVERIAANVMDFLIPETSASSTAGNPYSTGRLRAGSRRCQ